MQHRVRWILLLAATAALALASGCSAEDNTGADGGRDGALRDGAPGKDVKPGKDKAPGKDKTPPKQDTGKPCTPPTPPKPSYVDTCKLRHDQGNKTDLPTGKTPAGTAAVTVRLQTQAGDVQKVYLRVHNGLTRELAMTKQSSAGGVDLWRVTLGASARPVYYRFRLVDGGATLYLTRAGHTAAKPSGKSDFWLAPVAPGKTVHYKTTFTKPQLRVRSGSTYVTKAMVSAVGRFGATGVGAAGKELLFHIRDAATNKEDHPPGGGDYRLPADVGEAWLELGTVFDVPPELAKLGIIDSHTHPYDKKSGKLYLDSKPLTTELPKRGIKRALSMVPGSLSSQKAYMKALHKAHRWIVPLVWVSPSSHSVAGVEDLLKNHGFKGLKLHPTVHGFKADTKALDPFMVLAAKYRVPVQIHSATDSNSWPSRIVSLAKRHPTVPVVMIHSELGKTNKTGTLNQIKGVKNIYAETSWTNPESILQGMKTLDSSRTLFGTDATVDGYQHFTKKSIANPYGQYVYTVPAVMAQVKQKAHPGAWANWAYLTTIRLYAWRFRPDPDLYDTDGDGQADVVDGDDDNDGKADGVDSAPKNPGK